jgi:hypothetical protein
MNANDVYGMIFSQNKRLPEFEPLFMRQAFWSYLYSLNIIKGRWKEAEPIIITNPYYAWKYAKKVLKWKIKGNKDFYILTASKLWRTFPKNIKNCPDIMIAYFKEAVLK